MMLPFDQPIPTGLIQIHPFEKGLTLRFISCGLNTKPARPGEPRGATESFKTVYVHLPDGYEGVVREDYVKGRGQQKADSKQYGVYERDEAEENEQVFQLFLDELRGLVGAEKVKRYGDIEEADEAVG